MKKIIALLFIIFISYSFEDRSDRMRCFDDLDGSPTEKCYIYDAFNQLQYYDTCKKGKKCTIVGSGVELPTPSFSPSSDEDANYGVCAPVPFGGFEGSVCGDNAECFSNNCDGTKCGEPAEFCKMHSECEKGKFCNMTRYAFERDSDGHRIYYSPDHKCTELRDSDGDCYDDEMCLPLHLCHKTKDNDGNINLVGKCKKIGSFTNEPYVEKKLLCKSGFLATDKCVQSANIDCTNDNKLSGWYSTYDNNNQSFTFDKSDFSDDEIFSQIWSSYCRNSILDGSSIPIISTNSIKAFNEYADEVGNTKVKVDKKHANYGLIRYHYDNKKIKEKLITAMYSELYDNEDAECLLDVVKQLYLSGEKIKFSSLLVFAFAVLLL